VYRNVIKHAIRMYFYQRAGFEKTAATAGADWADAASHMRAGQDPQARPWEARRSFAKSDVSQIKDLHGGWFDAGDYNKYTSWTARAVIAVLRAYDENSNAFGDDSGIAESGNGIGRHRERRSASYGSRQQGTLSLADRSLRLGQQPVEGPTSKAI